MGSDPLKVQAATDEIRELRDKLRRDTGARDCLRPAPQRVYVIGERGVPGRGWSVRGLNRNVAGGVFFHLTVYFQKRLFGYFELGRSLLGECTEVSLPKRFNFPEV